MPGPYTRRDFVRNAASAAGALALSGGGQAAADTSPWQQVPSILAGIKPPCFPNRVFDITSYGAVGDGEHRNTTAFRVAIEACHRSGGGRVLVPAGIYHTAGIRLLS